LKRAGPVPDIGNTQHAYNAPAVIAGAHQVFHFKTLLTKKQVSPLLLQFNYLLNMVFMVALSKVYPLFIAWMKPVPVLVGFFTKITKGF
jgi:hypothetical protein